MRYGCVQVEVAADGSTVMKLVVYDEDLTYSDHLGEREMALPGGGFGEDEWGESVSATISLFRRCFVPVFRARFKRAGTSFVHARKLWKGRSIFSRSTENGPAFCECFPYVYKQVHSEVPALFALQSALKSRSVFLKGPL